MPWRRHASGSRPLIPWRDRAATRSLRWDDKGKSLGEAPAQVGFCTLLAGGRMYSERDDLEPAGPAHFGIHPEAVEDERPDPRPEEVRRMGLGRHTEEGALVEFASSLNGAKPGHKF